MALPFFIAYFNEIITYDYHRKYNSVGRSSDQEWADRVRLWCLIVHCISWPIGFGKSFPIASRKNFMILWTFALAQFGKVYPFFTTMRASRAQRPDPSFRSRIGLMSNSFISGNSASSHDTLTMESTYPSISAGFIPLAPFRIA